MDEFYFGVADGSAKIAIERLDYPVNILINYASKVRIIPKNRKKLLIDSGGFSFFFRLQEYQDSCRDYLNFVLKKDADYFANRDYPCEPELLRKNRTTVRENQEKTIRNQIEIMELLDNDFHILKRKFVAVLQGWKVEEYLNMLDLMKEQGLLTKRIGIGSICRRGQINEIRKIIFSIRKSLPKKYELHAFGTKLTALKFPDVWDSLRSVDSSAYRFMVGYLNGDGEKSISEQIYDRILKWEEKFKKIEKRHKFQTRLGR